MKYKVDMEYRSDGTSKKTQQYSKSKDGLVVLLALFVVLNLLAVIYVCLCKTVYFWSNADYWNTARMIASKDYYGSLFSTVYSSVINNEFNYVPALLPALFIKLFGQTRVVFVLSLVNCYLLPACILIYLFAKKIGKAPIVTLIITVLASPILIYLTFNGFTEMGGFTLALLCYYLYFRKNELNIFDYLLIGIVIGLLLIWNGWFVFFGVSFLTAMTAYAIIFKKKAYMGFVTLVAVLVFTGLFKGFIFKRLIVGYGVGSFDFNVLTNLKLITRYIGLVFIIAMVISTVNLIKKSEKRPIFVWIQILVCYITFTATRTHGQGHLLMYVPAFIMLMLLTVKYIKKEKVLVAVMALSLLNASSVLLPRKQPNNINEIKGLSAFPTFTMKPKVRDSVYDILSLKTAFDNMIPDGEYLGILAYSEIINNEIFKNIEPSLNKKQYRVGYIANTIPYFDLPETDIEPLCNANYMLVAYPAQMVREDQKIIAAAVDSFENWTDIGMAYEEMYEYETVIDGVTLKLYHRVRDVSDFEKARFRRKYFDMKN